MKATNKQVRAAMTRLTTASLKYQMIRQVQLTTTDQSLICVWYGVNSIESFETISLDQNLSLNVTKAILKASK